MSINYSNEIIEAIDTIVNQRINEVMFDKTEICTVISKVDEDGSLYWVNNGSIRYQAIASDKRTYAENSQVYVLIPQGDYELEKLIIGAYSSTAETPEVEVYSNIFDSFVKLYDLTPDSTGMLTKAEEQRNYKYDIDNTTIHQVLPNGFGTPEYLGFTFGANTYSEKEMPIGAFRISIDLLDSDNNSLLGAAGIPQLVYGSELLLGNPYNLSESIINEYLFQFPIRFMENDEWIEINDLTQIAKVSYTLLFDEQGEEDFSKIEIKNIHLYAGYNSETIGNSSHAVLDTTNEEEYTEAQEITMYMNWHDSNKNSIFNIQNPSADKTNIVYFLKCMDESPYTKVLDGVNDLGFQDIKESGVYWKTIGQYTANDLNAYIYKRTLSKNARKEQFKIGIKKSDGSYTETNGLTFYNTEFSEQGSNLANIDIDNLILSLEPGDDGVYNNYGIDNKIFSEVAYTKHKVTVNFADNTKWEEDNIKSIKWRVPYSATMIDLPTQYNEEGKKEYLIDWKNTLDQAEDGIDVHYYYCESKLQSIEFVLQDQFDYSKTHNTIYCEIELEDGSHYQGKLKLQFGIQGTSGTSYSFNIYPNRSGGLLFNTDDKLIFEARLENNKGELLSLPSDTEAIEWSYQYNMTTISVPKLDENGTPSTDDNGKVVMQQASYPSKELITYPNGQIGHVFEVNTKDLDNFDIGDQKYFLILTASYTITDTNGLKVNLHAYYPIPFASSHDLHLEGPIRIVYDYMGQNPTYYRKPYALQNLGEDMGVDDEEFECSLRYLSNDNKITEVIQNVYNVPTLTDNRELQPLNFMPSQSTPVHIFIAYTEDDKYFKYCCPILIMSNEYSSDRMNIWDGSTIMDTEEGAILSTMMGTGFKDSENKFSGVLLGKVALNSSNLDAKTGLYGFGKGQVRYKLDDEGNFFVGNGDSHIDFKASEGNEGELSIRAGQFQLKANNLALSSEGGGMGNIAGWNFNTSTFWKDIVVNESDTNYIYRPFMQTGNNPSSNSKCFGVNKFNTKKDGKGEIVTDGTAKETPFYVTFNGELHATKATITGNITAESLTIKDNAVIKGTLSANNISGGTLSGSSNITISGWTVGDVSLKYGTLGAANSIWLHRTGTSTKAKIGGYQQSGWCFTIADKFGVDKYGRVYCTGGMLASWNIDEQSLYSSEEYISVIFPNVPTQYDFKSRIKITPLKVGYRLSDGTTYRTTSWANLVLAVDYWDETDSSLSDFNYKKDISTYTQEYENFYDLLKPKKYKYINNNSDRFHTGFVAQEVVEALERSNLTTQDFAGVMLMDKGLSTEHWRLRRDEFVSLNTWQIQKLKSRVALLESEIKELKQKYEI